MRIVELTPHQSAPQENGTFVVTRPWMSASALERTATARGHEIVHLPEGPADADTIRGLLAGADAVVIAPQSNPQPATPRDARDLADALLRLVASAGERHVVLVSHFLVGHGPQHRNAKAGTWGLRDFEHAVREHVSSWTIVRPTWLALDPPGSYELRLTQDPLTDGLVTANDVAEAVVAAVEKPEAARGTTFAVHAVPSAQPRVDTGSLFDGLVRDFEYAGAGR